MPYLIEDCLLYNENENFLQNNITKDKIVLPTSASLIFLTLVKSKGQLPEKDYIFNTLWKDYNIDLSGNTLNRYISILRKNISQLGISNEVICTAPKMGFYISDKITITSEDSAPCKDVSQKKKGNKDSYLLMVLLGIISTLIFLNIYKITENNSNLMLEKIGTLASCDIYSLRNHSEDYTQKAMLLIKEYAKGDLVCSNHEVYIFDANGEFIFKNSGRYYLSKCNTSKYGNVVGCNEVLIYE